MIPLAILIGVAFLAILCVRSEPADRPLLIGGFIAHELASIALLVFYGAYSGDMAGYELSARNIAQLVRADFGEWMPELLKLLAHESDSRLFRLGMSEVPTTAAAHGWAGVAQWLSGGDSLAAACFVVSAFGFLSKALLFGVVRDVVPASRREIAAYGTMFVPSVLFWTSGLIKEAFAMIGLGVLVHGLHRILVRRRFWMIPFVVLGGAIVASVKPYVLFPVAIGVAAWVLAARSKREIKVSHLVVALGVASVGVVVLGVVFPEFGVDRVSEGIAAQRRASALAGGSSFVGSEADEGEVDPSAGTHLLLLPLALVNALLRPFIFEVRTAPQLGAALENTVLFVMLASLVHRYKLRDIRNAIMKTPVVLASAVFALVFAAAVGLSSKNLGTVSRYRVPLMPAYVSAVLVLAQRLRDNRTGLATGPTPAPLAARKAEASPARGVRRFRPIAPARRAGDRG
jgi:hypothetical protein